MNAPDTRIRVILETDHLPEYAAAELQASIDCIRSGGEHAPWLSREAAIADLEAQIAALNRKDEDERDD